MTVVFWWATGLDTMRMASDQPPGTVVKISLKPTGVTKNQSNMDNAGCFLQLALQFAEPWVSLHDQLLTSAPLMTVMAP